MLTAGCSISKAFRIVTKTLGPVLIYAFGICIDYVLLVVNDNYSFFSWKILIVATQMLPIPARLWRKRT